MQYLQTYNFTQTGYILQISQACNTKTWKFTVISLQEKYIYSAKNCFEAKNEAAKVDIVDLLNTDFNKNT